MIYGGAWLIDRVWFGWLDLTPFTLHSELQVIQRYRWSTHFTVHRYTHALGFTVSTNCILATDNSLTCNFKSHMKSCFHRLIPFLPLFCNCQLNSISLLRSSYPGRLASRNSIRLYSTTFYAAIANFGNHLYDHFARTMRKTQPLNCWEGVFTAPFHSNGSYSIVVCVFVSTGICLPCRCLEMNVYSDFTIPAFERHVTISRFKIKSFLKFVTALHVYELDDRGVGVRCPREVADFSLLHSITILSGTQSPMQCESGVEAAAV
jgi:hypothetical protein